MRLTIWGMFGLRAHICRQIFLVAICDQVHVVIRCVRAACKLKMPLAKECPDAAPSLEASSTVSRPTQLNTHGQDLWIALIRHLFKVPPHTRRSGMRGKQSKPRVNWISPNFQITPTWIDYRVTCGPSHVLSAVDVIQSGDGYDYELLGRFSC